MLKKDNMFINGWAVFQYYDCPIKLSRVVKINDPSKIALSHLNRSLHTFTCQLKEAFTLVFRVFMSD